MSGLRQLLRIAPFVAAGLIAASAPPVCAERVLRVGIPVMPETLDPARATNAQELMAMAGIYDSLYAHDPLAHPPALVPLAAAAMPDVSADFRTYTIRIRPGIRFTPHPAFGSKPRELVAADFAYAARRVLDPKLRSPNLSYLEGRIEGLDALAARAKDEHRALDYDAPVSGLEVVDRYTLRIRLATPDPRFAWLLAWPLMPGVAREVVEAEGEGYGQHPIGSGGFKVESFVPGQRLTLVRNPAFRELRWESLLTPASRERASAHPMRGRQLPAVDRVELSSTPESVAELLALRRGELDLIMLMSPDLALRNGRLSDDLAKSGLRLVRDRTPIVLMWFFSMLDPVVGGNSREKVALRRAIALAFDDAEWIRVIYDGQASMRDQLVPPGIEGHLADYRSPIRFDPAAANALLDRTGYVRAADGYRRQPDGSALTVPWLIGTNSDARRMAEFTKRMFDRIGVRVSFETRPANERVKRMSQCRFGMALMDIGLGLPDGIDLMTNFASRGIGAFNMSCYRDPEFDAAFDEALVVPNGPARTELFRTMQSRLDTYMPARPVPMVDLLFLTRGNVVGPHGVIGDWLQLLTLGIDEGVAARKP